MPAVRDIASKETQLRCLHRLSICCVFAINLAVSRAIAQELPSEDLYARVLPSVVSIRVTLADGKIRSGSGFAAVGPNRIITCWHVVKDATSVEIIDSSKVTRKAVGIVDKDEAVDLAVLATENSQMKPLSLEPIEPKIGSRVYAIGSPLGLAFSISDGIVSQIHLLQGMRSIQFTCPVSSGNSGGPLFNTHGKVVGVVSWRIPDGQSLSFAIPSGSIVKLKADQQPKPFTTSIVAPVTSIGSGLNKEEAGKICSILFHVARAQMTIDIALGSISRLGPSPELPQASTGGGFAEGFARGAAARAVGRRRGQLDEITFYRDDLSTHLRILSSDSLLASDISDRNPASRPAIMLLRRALEKISMASESARASASSLVASNGESTLAYDFMAKAGVAARDGASIFSDYLRAMRLDPSVISELGVDGKILFGVMADPCTFRIGISVFPGDFLTVFSVLDSGLAKRIGIRSGDQLVSVNGIGFTSLLHARETLQTLLGSKVELVVIRDGKQKTLKFTMPKAA